MGLEQFFDNFELIAEAPNGVAGLRKMILQLAVQGKLVPQDSRDEPAKIILDRIIRNRNRQKNAIQEQNQNRLIAITENEQIHELPLGWAWFRVGDVFDFQYGKSLPANKRDEFGDVDVYGSNGIVGKYTESLTVQPAIIIGRKGSAGALNKALRPSWTTDVAYYCIPPEGLNFDYSFLLLQSLGLERLGKGIKPGLNRNEAYTLFVSLPPLAEQQRIVAKVDQLMSLCDELEMRQNKKRERSVRLNVSLVDRLLASREPDEFDEHWEHIQDNYFDLLYDNPENVGKLRQAILQLGVQGKLVLQDSSDEPAYVLLEKIKAEKERLIKEGVIRKQNPLSSIYPDEVPFDLPLGWEWIKVDDIFNVTGGIQKTPKRKPVSNIYPYLRVGNVYRNSLDLNKIEYFELFDGELEKYELKPDDILIVEGNGSENEIGRCAIWNGEIKECVHQNHLIRCRPYFREISHYVLQSLNSINGISEMKRLAITTSGLYNLSVGKIRGISVPLPPLQEQHRIVAKVDQLMALCDELVSFQSRRLSYFEKLSASLTHAVTSVPGVW